MVVGASVTTEQDADVELMLAVQRGDRAAFRALFEKHLAAVVGFATHFVGSRARAEELAQDAFLQVYRTRERYVPRARFKTWLYRIVANFCLSELRRPDTRARVDPFARPDPDGPGRRAPMRSEPTVHSAEADYLDREALARLQRVLAGLPAPQRAAVLLARAEGLSYEEVAVALGTSVGAVKSLIHRATLTLRRELGEAETP